MDILQCLERKHTCLASPNKGGTRNKALTLPPRIVAEAVRNPWNARHHYTRFTGVWKFSPIQRKNRRVSRFNPVNRQYNRTREPHAQKVKFGITVHHERVIIGTIYLPALKLDFKGIPYGLY